MAADELPTKTEWERGLTVAVLAYENGGIQGIRERLESDPAYLERCGTMHGA